MNNVCTCPASAPVLFDGTCCTPNNTAACLNKNCGTVTNNCGQTVSCGTCTAPYTCGGGGTPNVCGCNTCGGCFTAGTLIAMADGTSKPIEQVTVGDRVLGRRGRVNRVLGIDRLVLGERPLFALNDGPAFVTAGHPFLTEDGWKAIDPAATAVSGSRLRVGRLTLGDRLVRPILAGDAEDDGTGKVWAAAVPLQRLVGHPADPATPLYNLRLSGDQSHIANDIGVHIK